MDHGLFGGEESDTGDIKSKYIATRQTSYYCFTELQIYFDRMGTTANTVLWQVLIPTT